MKSKATNALAEGFIEYSYAIGALELVPEGHLLKSGRLSFHFLDSGKFSSSETMKRIASEYARVIAEQFREGNRITFDLLYGPPYKGTLLVSPIAMALDALGFGNIRFCSSRKERKNHGEGGLHIGTPIKKGSRVLIIDDVITDGETKRETVDYIRKYGGQTAGLVVALNREECGTGILSAAQEFEQEYAVPVCAVATLTDLISFLEKSVRGSYDAKSIALGVLIAKIRSYQEKYCAE